MPQGESDGKISVILENCLLFFLDFSANFIATSEKKIIFISIEITVPVCLIKLNICIKTSALKIF